MAETCKQIQWEEQYCNTTISVSALEKVDGESRLDLLLGLLILLGEAVSKTCKSGFSYLK